MNQGSPSITLRDIAKKLGISHAAVSLALRGNSRVSPQLREKVKRVAEEMGYRPNAMATALGQLRSESMLHPVSTGIAWINCWENPLQLRALREFDLYWRGAFQAAEKAGYHLEEFVLNDEMPLPRLEQILKTRNIRGILLPPVGRHTPNYSAFHWDQFAAVRFGYSLKEPPFHVVTSDQLTNSLLAFENILRLGYQRIGFVTSMVARTRFKAGFLMAQSELPATMRLPMLVMSTGENDSGDQAMLSSWMKKYRPDAILSDIAALPYMLKLAGYRVPQDVGLAALSVLDGGVDSGIHQNSEQIGKTAVETLISLIHHSHWGIPSVCREILIEGKWVDGASLPIKAARLA